MDGALLIHKEAGVTSFGVIEQLQRAWMEATGLKRRDLPKMGHGGTLDPFATGLLVIGVGRGVKLSRYILGSDKTYKGTIRFGQTTIPGDPTDPVSESTGIFPPSLEAIQTAASAFCGQTYTQTPPMHSAVKKNGVRLYELARAGQVVQREPRACRLSAFRILSYLAPRAEFEVTCSSGTYIRVLAQDLGKHLGTVAMLDRLERTGSGKLRLENALSVDQVRSRLLGAIGQGAQAAAFGSAWLELKDMVAHFPRVEAAREEGLALTQGKQEFLPRIVARAETTDSEWLAIFSTERLIAIAKREGTQAQWGPWGLERVFVDAAELRT